SSSRTSRRASISPMSGSSSTSCGNVSGSRERRSDSTSGRGVARGKRGGEHGYTGVDLTTKLYKAAEVCELLQVQPYVLRSWEKEFPGIGVQAKGPEGPRLYRQSDVEHVQRIKQLVFGEGLTVAGARRRLDASAPAISVVSE